MKLSDLDFTICTSIKNREKFLRKVVPTWKELPFSHCIIVDWDSDKPLHQSLSDLVDERFTFIRVENQPYYWSSVCHNISLGFVKTEWVLRTDGDIIFNYRKLLNMEIDVDSFYVGGVSCNKGTEGTILAKHQWFIDTGGYDERQKHYGWEDYHCYYRIRKQGYEMKRFPRQSLIHIDHADDMRLKHRDIDNIKESMDSQMVYDFMSWNKDSCKYTLDNYTVHGKMI